MVTLLPSHEVWVPVFVSQTCAQVAFQQLSTSFTPLFSGQGVAISLTAYPSRRKLLLLEGTWRSSRTPPSSQR